MNSIRTRVFAGLALATTVGVASSFVLSSSAIGGDQSAYTHGPGKRGFSAFAINPRDTRTVYAGTGSGVFKSTDAGETWQAASHGLTNTYVFDLAIVRQRPATLYAATQEGVFKSTNAGSSWRPTGFGKENAIAIVIDPHLPARLYVANDQGVFKSTDGGEHWVTAWRGSRVFALALNPRRPTTLYAGSGLGVVKSLDAGANWSPRNRGLFRLETGQEVGHRVAEGFVLAFAVNPHRPSTLYLSCDYGVFKTTNGARSWQRVSRGLPGSKKYRLVGSLALDPGDPQTLYAGTWGLGGGGADVFKSSNGGRSWTSLRLPQRRYVIALALDPHDSQTVYAGTVESAGRAFKSSDGGRTWKALVVPSL